MYVLAACSMLMQATDCRQSLLAEPCTLLLQRVVLLSYDPATQRISFRHYSIGTAPSGVTKGVKALVGGRGVPNLSEMKDVSELLTRSGYGSVMTPLCCRSFEYA